MPLTNLRDRVDKRVDLDCTKSNPEPLVSQIQEMKFVNHFKDLASVGQAHTMIEMVFMTKILLCRLKDLLLKNFLTRYCEITIQAF